MGKVALVFAGQGAQSVGICKDLYASFDAVKVLFDMSEATRDLCFDGPKEQLDITINTQPAVFLADLACAIALSEKGITADGAAGFSLGEIAAACYAGLMSRAQAFDFVSHRAKAMQDCAEKHKGSMFAVLRLSSGQVEDICSLIPGTYPVNYNAPGQTVVACADSSAEQLRQTVSKQRGKAVKLAVSGAFHSVFMDKAAASAAAYLKKESMGAMQIPLYSNVTARVYDDPKELLAKQINHPVLWQKTIENMVGDGFDTFIEAGPGKTLSGLIKKIAPDVRVFNVSDIPSLDNTVKEVHKRAP